jgi:hypothetical protein
LSAKFQEHCQADDPFDTVFNVWSPGDEREKVAEQAAVYAEAGATWLIKSLDHSRFGWDASDKPWPLSEMRLRIQQGPPRQ